MLSQHACHQPLTHSGRACCCCLAASLQVFEFLKGKALKGRASRKEHLAALLPLATVQGEQVVEALLSQCKADSLPPLITAQLGSQVRCCWQRCCLLCAPPASSVCCMQTGA